MSGGWSPSEESRAPSQSSRRSYAARHSLGSGMGIIKQILGDVKRKHKGPSMFVPANENGLQSSCQPQRPGRICDPNKPCSTSMDSPGMLCPPPSFTRRQISDPLIRNRDQSSSLAASAGGLASLGELHVDTDGHTECAGSGLDYVTVLSPDDFSPDRTSDLSLRERAMSQVAMIKSLVDERDRELKHIEEDIKHLERYLVQAEREYPGYDDDSEQNNLRSQIATLEEQLKLLHQKNPDLVPPPVPAPRPPAYHSCPCCTISNDTCAYRCRECGLPLKIDPLESKICCCQLCTPSTDQLELSSLPDFREWIGVNKYHCDY